MRHINHVLRHSMAFAKNDLIGSEGWSLDGLLVLVLNVLEQLAPLPLLRLVVHEVLVLREQRRQSTFTLIPDSGILRLKSVK